MNNSPNDILKEICGNRKDLFDLGCRFNKEVERLGNSNKSQDRSDLNDATTAIFELEDIRLSAEEIKINNTIDRLNWTDEQGIEFLKALGGV